jgi:hypothetical protein
VSDGEEGEGEEEQRISKVDWAKKRSEEAKEKVWRVLPRWVPHWRRGSDRERKPSASVL